MLEAMAPRARHEPVPRGVQHARRSATTASATSCFPAEPADPRDRAATAAMQRRHARAVRRMLAATRPRPEFAAFARERFGPFDFDGIEQRLPSATFEGALELDVGDRVVELIEVGPAHSAGDAIAHVPDAAAVFTRRHRVRRRDTDRVGRTASNWLEACERSSAWRRRRSSPATGRSPTPTACAPCSATCSYVRDEATAALRRRNGADEAADDIELGEFADLGDPNGSS